MRKFLFVFLLAPIATFAQDRIDTKLPEISSNVLWSINNADGWMHNNEGKWIEGKNKIQQETASIAEKDIWDSYNSYTTGTDNFNLMELREVNINGEKDLILIKRMNDGMFKYESIKKDWEVLPMIKYAVFKMSSGMDVSADSNKAVYKVPVIYEGHVLFPGSEGINKISLDINKKLLEKSDYSDPSDLYIYYKTYKDKSRFFASVKSRLVQSEKLLPLYGGAYDKEPLQDFYYEVPIGSLDKLLKYLK